jgi:hypothetical protein
MKMGGKKFEGMCFVLGMGGVKTPFRQALPSETFILIS